MPTVSLYLLREFLRASGLVFGGLIVIWLAADTLLHVDELMDEHGIREIGVRLLEIAPFGAPLACALGVVWSLTAAVRHREVAAIRCGGIPLRRTLLPILGACVALAAILALLEDRLIVPARARLDAAQSGAGDALRPSEINGRWWHASGRSVFSAERYDEGSGRLEAVTVFRFDAEGRVAERIDAAYATSLVGEAWEFHDARTYRFAATGLLDTRPSSTLQINLGVSGEALARVANAGSLTLRRLVRSIRAWTGSDEGLRSLWSTLHRRLAQPFSALALVLLVIPVAIGDVERGDSLPRALLQSVVIASAFFALWGGAQFAATLPNLPPGVPVWVLMAGVLGLGALRFRAISE